ncbi:MAG TPA: methylated-DNA--[protein]-cysteine S-methyltransferase [Myxococcaceae bacterium]|nr:methylated-DNA--[protein]-cysteine S-methyltransferase [Myxococcaceae bacterium]
MKTLEVATLDSPIGPLGVAAEGGVLVAVTFDGLGPLRRWASRVVGPSTWVEGPDPAGVCTLLRRFFAGELDALSAVPVRLHGTDFQRRTWQALRRIPSGETWSYRRLAEELGDRRATRAVGAANGQNPIPVVIPCHRVIGSDGSLTGFGGGLERKRWLLQHERALQPVLPL